MTGADVNKSEEAGPTSLSLLARVQAQDQAAWERLVSLYSPLVYGWCVRAGLQPADAADIGQEVFLAVARSIRSFRHDQAGATFRGWLYRITCNKVRDRDRAAPPGGIGIGGSDARRTLEQVPVAGPGSSDAPVDGGETAALYRRAMALIRTEFEPRTWQAFWRVTVAGERPADVAADLGLTLNAVYLARSRVLRRLRDEFVTLIEF